MRLAAIPLVCLLGASAPAREIDIVRDGRPRACVVVAQDASAQLKSAVELLVSCVQESTGVRLFVSDHPTEGANSIFVGRSAATEGFAVDLEGLDGDGFVIAFPDERCVFIIGPTDWGTEFGVYEFLERYVGVRWLLPGDDGTDVPKHASIAIPREPVRQAPAFFSRLFSGLRGSAQGKWARCNRMHGRVSFHHYLLHLFPAETYTKSHPEFFPIINGKRYLPNKNIDHHWQPCLTAPGIVEEAVANITRYFDEHPEATSYSLGMNDSSNFCQCEGCLARISGETNFLGKKDYSDLYYDWANKVIEGVLKKHPDKWFGCLAYSDVAAPPKNVKVHPRLIPYMTYDRMKWKDPDIRKDGEALTLAWHRRSPVLGWYDYIYGTPYCLPRVWFHHMADYYRFGHANGVRALYAEAYPNWGEGPKLYVSLKLQWDPTRNVDELLDEWYVRCVGEDAAPFLAQYYAYWEDFWTRRALASDWFGKVGQYLSFYNPGYLNDVCLAEIDASRKLLETTVARASTKRQKARAELLLRAFEYYESTAYAFSFETGLGGPVTTEGQALAVLESAGKRISHAVRRRELALKEFPAHPVLVHPIPMTRSPLLQGDSLGGGLWSVFDFASKADGPVRKRIREIAANARTPEVRGQAKMMLDLLQERPDPLTQNHSFEEGEGSDARHWWWWVKNSVGSMARTNAAAHTGAWSVLCDGMQRGGPVQELDVKPGKYGLVCFVYVPAGQRSTGTAELSMTLRDEKGNNLPSVSTKIVPPPGRWTALAVAADVPEKIGGTQVKKVMPILIVNGFKLGERVYVDDVMLYRLRE